MKIALVHDWLTGMRGGEKVLEVLCELYPKADIFTLLHIPGSVPRTIERYRIVTSPLQKMPFAREKYRYYLPAFPLLIESFDLSGYDLVISSSHAVAKGVRVPDKAPHISYIYTPMRYMWDMYGEYFGKEQALPIQWAGRIIRPYLQGWDKRSSQRVGYFIAISKFVAERIKTFWGREAEVIYPPVEVKKYIKNSKFEIRNTKQILNSKFKILNSDYYLIVSSLVPYKRVDLAIHAFNNLDRDLVIAGTGPEEERLKRLAKGKNIKFLGWVGDKDLPALYAHARAFLMPQIEDFGISAVESQACGTPVIAFGKGGALEIVIEGKTGIFFKEQTTDSLISAVKKIERMRFDPAVLRQNALRFDEKRFKERFRRFVGEKMRV